MMLLPNIATTIYLIFKMLDALEISDVKTVISETLEVIVLILS